VRWKDEICGEVGVMWGRMAQVRSVWKKIGEAYAGKWVE